MTILFNLDKLCNMLKYILSSSFVYMDSMFNSNNLEKGLKENIKQKAMFANNIICGNYIFRGWRNNISCVSFME